MSRLIPSPLGTRTLPQVSVPEAAEGTQLGMYVVEFPIVKPANTAVFSSDQGFAADGVKPEGPAELILNFDQSPPADQSNGSSSPHTITEVGGVLSNEAAALVFGSGGARFDGVDDFFSAPDSPAWDILAGDFFIEMRINLTDLLANYHFVSHGDTANGWRLLMQTDGRITFQTRIASSGTNYDSAIGVLTAGSYITLGVERIGTTVYFYIDGEVVSTTTMSVTNTFTGPLRVGASLAGGGAFFKGDMDNLVIMKTQGPGGQDYFVRDYPWEDFDNL